MANWNEPTPDPGGCAEDVITFALLVVLVAMLGVIISGLFGPEFSGWIWSIRLPAGW